MGPVQRDEGQEARQARVSAPMAEDSAWVVLSKRRDEFTQLPRGLTPQGTRPILPAQVVHLIWPLGRTQNPRLPPRVLSFLGADLVSMLSVVGSFLAVVLATSARLKFA
jgi:hypothetical protein